MSALVTPAADSVSTDALRKEILAALDTRIEPVKTTIGYRFSIAVVALLMILLPVIYVALIGLIGFGVYWHLVNDVGMLSANVKGKGKALVLGAYAAPAIIGVIVVAVMLKPLFARRRSSGLKPQTVKRDDEPFLYEFVDRLCDAVGSPRPKSILLSHDVNAAAALVSGVLNPFRHDLMLVIGLPLVAGMNLRQLASVLAHEFGHFSQGTGMRLGGFIDPVNSWFAFVVFQRDSWDLQLEKWSRELDLRAGWIIYAARGCVWMTRKILYGLMLVGYAMSRRLSREMEFDADRHAARLSGGDAFAETLKKLPVLGGARNWAINDLNESYREGRLADEFFKLIAVRESHIPDDIRKQLMDRDQEAKTSWFDTHPNFKDREASVARENAAGLFQIEVPASVLFRDFSATCRAETKEFYRYQLNKDIPAANLVSIDTLLADQQLEQDCAQAVARVILNFNIAFCPIPVPEKLEPLSDSIEATLLRIAKLKKFMRQEMEQKKDHAKRITASYRLTGHANQAESLLGSGLKVGKDLFMVSLQNADEIAQARQQAKDETADAQAILDRLFRAMAERLTLPLRLLSVPDVAARLQRGPEIWSEARQLVQCEAKLQQLRTDVLQLPLLLDVLNCQLLNYESSTNKQDRVPGVLKSMNDAVDALSALRDKTAEIPYPFRHADQGVTAAKYLIPELPDRNTPAAIAASLNYTYDEAIKISDRIIARLCAFTEMVEGLFKSELDELATPTDETAAATSNDQSPAMSD